MKSITVTAISYDEDLIFNEFEFKIVDLKIPFESSFDLLKKIGAFVPIDDEGWIKQAEDNVWNELEKFKK
jgi:hypothetical protein